MEEIVEEIKVLSW